MIISTFTKERYLLANTFMQNGRGVNIKLVCTQDL